MPEAANGEPLTVQRALKTIADLEGLEPGLFLRTEGITWMIWGIVTGAIYFSFGTVGSYFEESPPFWFAFLWVPWVAAGITATYAVWRSVHLGSPAERPHYARKGLTEMATITGIFAVLFAAGFLLARTIGPGGLHLLEPGFATLILGFAALLMGARGHSSPPARRMLFVIGSLSLAVALLFALVPIDPIGRAYLLQTVGGAVVAGGGWFLGGVWLTLKG